MSPRRPRQYGQIRIATLAAGAAVLLILLAGLAWTLMSQKTPAPQVAFVTLSGEQMHMADLRGKVVLVNFWATSCATCVKEMPQMADTYNRFHERGLEFVAVAMQYDPPNYVQNFARTRALPFKVALDTQGDVARAFGDVKLTPTTFVIDKQGNIIKRYLGEPDFNELHRLIEAELATA